MMKVEFDQNNMYDSFAYALYMRQRHSGIDVYFSHAVRRNEAIIEGRKVHLNPSFYYAFFFRANGVNENTLKRACRHAKEEVAKSIDAIIAKYQAKRAAEPKISYEKALHYSRLNRLWDWGIKQMEKNPKHQDYFMERFRGGVRGNQDVLQGLVFINDLT